VLFKTFVTKCFGSRNALARNLPQQLNSFLDQEDRQQKASPAGKFGAAVSYDVGSQQFPGRQAAVISLSRGIVGEMFS
jgi:hypothetical protein